MLTEWLGVVYLTPSAAGGAAVAAIWERIHVLAVRFKSIKQDRRIERPEARGRHRLSRGRGAKRGEKESK